MELERNNGERKEVIFDMEFERPRFEKELTGRLPMRLLYGGYPPVEMEGIIVRDAIGLLLKPLVLVYGAYAGVAAEMGLRLVDVKLLVVAYEFAAGICSIKFADV